MSDSREYIRGVIKALGCTQKRFVSMQGFILCTWLNF